MPAPPPLDGSDLAPSTRRAVATLVLAACAVVGLAGLAERAWLARDLPLAPPPAAAAATAPAAPAPSRAPPSSSFLLVIVDGLREAAVATMPAWQALVAESPGDGGAGAASGIAVVGDPTMSAPCVRAIVTGRRPDLYASFRNFDPVPVQGSVPQLLAARRWRVAHAGDGLLPRLCPDAYRPEDVVTVPRPQLRTVRDLDDRTFPRALEFASDPSVDVLTVHLVTVDLTGHASGATSAAYAAAVAEADVRLGALVLAFRRAHPGAHVLVAADHGLSAAGTHGSGEPEARRAPFVLLGPRVARRRGLEIPQEALASTLAALLSLPPPPLAEVPPALGLLRLSDAERRAALDAFAGARAAAHALDEVRQAAAAARTAGPGEVALLRALLALDAAAPRRGTGAVAALAVALVAFLLAAGGGRAGAVRGGAVVVGLVAVAGAGLAFHRATVGADAVAALARRLPLVAAVIAVVVAAVGGVFARRARARPRGVGSLLGAAAVLGAAVAGVRSMRLPIDGAVHLPLLVGALLVVGAGLASRRAGSAVPLGVRLAFPLAVAGFVAVTRGLEVAWGETWLADEGTSVLAPLAVLVAVAGVAALGARLPSRGGPALVAFLLGAGVAVFHALGGGESLGRLDPGRVFVPGAAGAVAPTTWAAGLAGAAARHAVTWGILLLAARASLARASLARGGAGARLPAVVAALAVAVATGACVLVVAAGAWAPWAWWMVVAVPVVALAAVDAVAIAVAGTGVLWWGRRRGTTVRGTPVGHG